MKKNCLYAMLVGLLLIGGLAPCAQALVEWERLATIDLPPTATDIQLSASGRYVYMLDRQGAVKVLDLEGRVLGSFAVGTDVDAIRSGPQDDILMLVSGKANQLQFYQLDFVQSIPTARAFSKGPDNAPVTVAVFSDFQ